MARCLLKAGGMSPKDLNDYAKALWRSRLRLFYGGVIGIAIGLVVAFSMPRLWTSSAKLAPEESHKELSGTASTLVSMMGVDAQRVEGISSALYPDITSSSPFLMEFAEMEVGFSGEEIPLWDYLLSKQKRAWWSYIFALPSRLFSSSEGGEGDFNSSPTMQHNYIEAMRESVIVTRDEKLGTIFLNSTFQDPVIAQMVADSIIATLQSYMIAYKTANTRTTLLSNTSMYEDAKREYFLAEELYATASDQNQNIVKQSERIHLERLRNERNLAYQIYSQLALQVGTDKVKLHQEESIATIIEPPTFPIKPSSPRRVLIICSLAFLGLSIASLRVILSAQREG